MHKDTEGSHQASGSFFHFFSQYGIVLKLLELFKCVSCGLCVNRVFDLFFLFFFLCSLSSRVFLTHASLLGASSSNWFVIKEIVNILLKVRARSRMSNKDDLSGLVNHSSMWHSCETILFVRGALSVADVILLWKGPSFRFTVFLDRIVVFVDRETNDSDFISPFFLSLFKNLLITFHWWLAWRAPSGPELKPDYLSFLVHNVLQLSLFVYLACILNSTHRLSDLSFNHNINIGI